MNRFTLEERRIIISFVCVTIRRLCWRSEFRRCFPGRSTLTEQTLRHLTIRLQETGTTRDASKIGQDVEPGTSIRR